MSTPRRLFPFRVIGLCLVVWALGVTIAHADEDARDAFRRRQLPARKLSEAPVIDGDLSDRVWQEAAIGDTFTDQKTSEIVRDQTRFWLGYDDVAIYFAAYCYDAEPDKLVMRETKRDSRLHGDDNIEFQIDPYHTHQFRDLSMFMVNPRGTQASRIGGGRSGKTEWKGDWQAAARVQKDGWTVEMAIPWSILTYPGTDKPTTIGFNVVRNHARQAFRSWFSNIGRQWRNQWAADWVGVQLPASHFQPELLALPFFAAGATERDDLWQETARGGLDLRYRPTPQMTAVVALNPDFRNIQGEIAGIDFSRGERWVDETRPFFEEGGDMFRTWSGVGDYFYSRRIKNIDAGAKLYGKLARRTNLGFLSTFDFADRRDKLARIQRQDYLTSLTQGLGEWGSLGVTGVVKRSPYEDNVVLGYQADASIRKRLNFRLRYGSSAFRGIDPDADSDEASSDVSDPPSVFLRGDTANFGINWGSGTIWLGGNLSYLSPDFRATDGFFEYPGRRNFALNAYYGNQWRNAAIRRVDAEFWANYSERYRTGPGTRDLDGLVSRAFSTIGDRDANERFFSDGIGYWVGVETRNNVSFNHSADVGHFREEGSPTSDLDWSMEFSTSLRSADRNRRVHLSYSFGRADAMFRHFVSTGAFLKMKAFSFGLRTSILRHRERRQQHILSMNYDISSTITVGGRIVFQRDDATGTNNWNPYLSFRRSGAAGIDTFLILGDPSGDRFVPRLEGKVLFPL